MSQLANNARRENGYIKSFIGKLSDELLNVKLFDRLLVTRVLNAGEYVARCDFLGYRSPAKGIEQHCFCKFGQSVSGFI